MRIRVKAELILIIPKPRKDERPEAIVLGVETRLNDLGAVHILTQSAEDTTRVGIRIHIKGISSVDNIET